MYKCIKPRIFTFWFRSRCWEIKLSSKTQGKTHGACPARFTKCTYLCSNSIVARPPISILWTQSSYTYLPTQIPSQQLNQLNQPFSTRFKLHHTQASTSNSSPIGVPQMHSQFTTSTPWLYHQQVTVRGAPTPPFLNQPTNFTQPTQVPTYLSGFCNVQDSLDQNKNARSGMQLSQVHKFR